MKFEKVMGGMKTMNILGVDNEGFGGNIRLTVFCAQLNTRIFRMSWLCSMLPEVHDLQKTVAR